MNPLMQNKPKDGMVIQIVGQRNPVRADRLPHGLKVFKGGLSFYEPRPHNLSGIIVFGEDELVFVCSLWKPQMIGRVMLKQGPWT